MSKISNPSTDLFVVYLTMLSLDETMTLKDKMIIEKWITKKEEGHGCDLIWSPILTFSLLEGKNQHNPQTC